MTNNYIMINPWIDGKNKKIYKSDNALDSAKKAYNDMANNFSNNIPSFHITLQKINSSKDIGKGSNNDYYHFKINEQRGGKNNIKFDLQEISFNKKDNLVLEQFKKNIYKTILDINKKNKSGGRRKRSKSKSRRRRDDDDDDELFDDEEDIIDDILDKEEDKLRRRRRRRRDDYYDEIYDEYKYRKYSDYFGWYYSPYVYNRFLVSDRFYVPTFTLDNIETYINLIINT